MRELLATDFRIVVCWDKEENKRNPYDLECRKSTQVFINKNLSDGSYYCVDFNQVNMINMKEVTITVPKNIYEYLPPRMAYSLKQLEYTCNCGGRGNNPIGNEFLPTNIPSNVNGE